MAVAALMSFAPIFADDSKESATQVKSRAAADGNPTSPELGSIPECIRKLKLSAEQEKKIQELVLNYDDSSATVWKQFGELYLKTIAVETSMLSAIEDNFTDEQRQQVREARHKMAHHETATAKSGAKAAEPTRKPADIVKEEVKHTGVTLTSEQQEVAETIEAKYRPHLRKLNHRILELHSRLISLEAEEMAAIEKELTEDQLVELRKNRRTGPTAQDVVNHDAQLSKIE